MTLLYVLLYLLAGVCFGLSAGIAVRRHTFLALGLLLWVAVDFLKAAENL